MKKLFCLVSLFAFGAVLTSVSEKTTEPLPDYFAQFNEADAKIRAINESDPTCTNYLYWVQEAIECKRELKQRDTITPWLAELANTYTNNWKIQHAVALGYRIDYERWESIQCMDQAFRLAQGKNADDKAIGQLCLDYIDCLLIDRVDTPYELQVKMPGVSYTQHRADLEHLWDVAITNPTGEVIVCNLHDLPDWVEDAQKQHELLEPNLPQYQRVFYALPDSYASAENDGELIRWLIENRPSDGYGLNGLQHMWTMPDFAVLIAGTHINLPCPEESILGGYDRIPAKENRAFLAALKDNETIVWGNDNVSNRVIQLPADYCYIADYEKRADQGEHDAAETLGNIFINRFQLERAAHYFERAGKSEMAQSIRGNQGTFLAHRPYPEGVSSTIDYVYRNGTEVTFEIYPIITDTNLLARLISRNMLESEMSLLQGDPFDFQRTTQTNRFIIPDQPTKSWTHRLSPLPDHQDRIDTIQIPELKSGNYLMRANLSNGNRAETVLHVYDTLLYSSAFYSTSEYGYKSEGRNIYFLCEALTGKPLPDEDLHFLDLAGGGNRVDNEWVDGAYSVNQYKRGRTNRDGVYLADESDKYDRTVMARLNHRLPFSVHKASVRFAVDDTRDYWEQESSYDLPDVFMTSDRPLYRPGDTGYIKLWMAGDYRPSPSVTLQKDKFKIPLIVSTVDQYGDAYFDEFGGIDYSFTIPSNAPLGAYEYEFNHGQKSSLRVEEYRLPDFDITASLTTNQTVEISASYSYGKPLTEGDLHFYLSYIRKPQPDWHPNAPFDFLWGNGYWWNGNQFWDKPDENRPELSDCWKSVHTNLNPSGQFSFDLSTVEDATLALTLPGYFCLNATVTDRSHEQLTKWIILPVTFPERSLSCWMDKAFYASDEVLVCHTAFEDQTGPLHLVINSLASEVPIQTIPVSAEGTIQLNPLSPGIYQASLVSEVYSSQPFQFAVLGDSLSSPADGEPIRFILEKGQYAAGETARLLVLVDQPGRYVYWFDRAADPDGLTAPPSVLHMDTTYKVVSLPLTKEMDKGIIKSAAMTIVNGKHHLASCTIPIIGSGQEAGTLQLNTEKKSYSPGESVTLSIQSLDSKGKGMPSSVTVTVYNRSLDLVAGNKDTPYYILKTLFGGWANHLNQILELSDPHRTTIRAICPLWAMRLLMPQGELPFFNGVFDLDELTVFGGSQSIGSALAENLDSLDLRSEILPIREDFRDLAYWNAAIETDSNGCASATFPMPDGLVEWKIKAWAMHTNYAASATTTLRCAKDFVIQLNPPRFMTEGDRLELSSSLRNHTTNTLNVVATCSESGSVIQVESPEDVSLPAVAPDQQTLLYWNAYAVGYGTSYLTTTAQSETSSDGMKKPIPVHPHGMLKRGGTGGVLAEKNNKQKVQIEIPQATALDTVNLRVNCSTDMLDALIGALPFLAEYPHGCTEQTLNRFLPSVIALQTMDDLGVDILTKTNAMPAGREMLLNRNAIIARAQEGIDRLEDAHHYKGTWGWNLQSGDSQGDYLITAWVLRGLHRASQVEGLNVDSSDIKDSMEFTLDYMNAQMKPPTEQHPKTITDIDTMLALVIAEIGINENVRYGKTREEDHAVLNHFLKHLLAHADKLSLYGKILLANAFDRQGDYDNRDRIIQFIEQYLESDPKLGTYWLRTSADDWWYWYNDHIETIAWYLKLLNRTEPDSEKTAGIVRYLMQNRTYGDHWKSTRDTAICIEALCEYAENNRIEPGTANYEILLNGAPLAFSESGRYESTELAAGENTLLINASGKTPVFYDATWQYYTREDPISPEQCDLVSISRVYYRHDPLLDKQGEAPLQPTDVLNAGETIDVELILTATHPLEYLLAEDKKPGGFECVENLSGYAYGKGVGYYQELHDERVSFYINRLSKGTSTIHYKIRAEHAGTISALPATVELMYEPHQAANSAENKFKIVR